MSNHRYSLFYAYQRNWDLWWSSSKIFECMCDDLCRWTGGKNYLKNSCVLSELKNHLSTVHGLSKYRISQITRFCSARLNKRGCELLESSKRPLCLKKKHAANISNISYSYIFILRIICQPGGFWILTKLFFNWGHRLSPKYVFQPGLQHYVVIDAPPSVFESNECCFSVWDAAPFKKVENRKLNCLTKFMIDLQT
jgi:hypothetical protein